MILCECLARFNCAEETRISDIKVMNDMLEPITA